MASPFDAKLVSTICSFLAVVVCISLFFGYLMWKKRNRGTKNKSSPTSKVRLSRRCPPKLSIRDLQENNIIMPPPSEFDDLEELDNIRNNTRLQTEFTSTHGQRHNFDGLLNLDPEVLPYDFNRVRLKSPIDGLDYINASWLSRVRPAKHGHDVPKSNPYLPSSMINFILSQDPMNNTLVSYYHMIHEREIDIIVRVGNKEMPMIDSPETTQSFGHMVRKRMKQKHLQNYLTRDTIEIVNNTSNDYKHTTTMFNFQDWPTDDVFSLDNTHNLLVAISLVRKETSHKKRVVTLMAQDDKGGISGAAVFIVLYNLLEKFDEALLHLDAEFEEPSDESDGLDVYDAVNEFRKSRALVISSFSEYAFLFRALTFYAQNKREFDQIIMKKKHK